jgi:hypothetical protein
MMTASCLAGDDINFFDDQNQLLSGINLCLESWYEMPYLREIKLTLLIINSGVKKDCHYHIKHFLQDYLLLNAQNLYGEDYFCFQQETASSSKATRNQKWLTENVPKTRNT